MKNRLKTLLAAAIVACTVAVPSSTFAQRDDSPAIISHPHPADGSALLSNCDLTGACQTAEIKVFGYSLLKIQVRFVGAGNATDIGFTCEESDDKTAWSQFSTVAPDGTAKQFNPTQPATTDVNWTVRPDVTGFKYFRCDFTAAGASAGDAVTVFFHKIRGI